MYGGPGRLAEIILSQAGAALRTHLLPGGIGVFGKTLSGAALGEAIGRAAGRSIDASEGAGFRRFGADWNNREF